MPTKTILTKNNIAYIKRNRFKISGSDMAKKFGVTKNVVGSYMRNHGLQVDAETKKKFKSKAMTGKTTFSKKEDQFIRDNYLTLPVKQLGAMMNRSFTGIAGRLKAMWLKIPAEIIQQRKEIGRMKPGNISFNKGKRQAEYMTTEAIERTKATRFKKGNLPHNTKEKDGVISVRYDHVYRNGKPYKYIRLSLGKWYPLHQHLWEKKHGKVKKGMCLWFHDGNTLNCKLSNLELITRAENMKRNTIHNYSPEIVQATQLRGALNRQINKHLKNIKNEK